MRLGPVAAANGMLYAHPDGSARHRRCPVLERDGRVLRLPWRGRRRFRLSRRSRLPDQAKADVDSKRVFFVGHSNGGFMSYRVACDHAAEVAAIVSLAGATFATAASCAPSSPVAVLEIHGSADDTVLFDGGNLGALFGGPRVGDYPGAGTSVATWAAYDGCDASATAIPAPLDLDASLIGPTGPAETSVEAYSSGCRPGGHAELWTIGGGSHVPISRPASRRPSWPSCWRIRSRSPVPSGADDSTAPTRAATIAGVTSLLDPSADQLAMLGYLREADPVHWSAELNMWVLTRHQDISTALRDPRFGRGYPEGTAPERDWSLDIPAIRSMMDHLFLAMDPPDHTRLRGLVNRAFTPAAIAAIEPRIAAIVDDLLGGDRRARDLRPHRRPRGPPACHGHRRAARRAGRGLPAVQALVGRLRGRHRHRHRRRLGRPRGINA